MMKPSKKDLAIFGRAYEKYRARLESERTPNEAVYINLKTFVNWLTEQYGAARGEVANTIFDILAYLQQMEKVEM